VISQPVKCKIQRHASQRPVIHAGQRSACSSILGFSHPVHLVSRFLLSHSNCLQAEEGGGCRGRRRSLHTSRLSHTLSLARSLAPSCHGLTPPHRTHLSLYPNPSRAHHPARLTPPAPSHAHSSIWRCSFPLPELERPRTHKTLGNDYVHRGGKGTDAPLGKRSVTDASSAHERALVDGVLLVVCCTRKRQPYTEYVCGSLPPPPPSLARSGACGAHALPLTCRSPCGT
jgi:hypothetical protein